MCLVLAVCRIVIKNILITLALTYVRLKQEFYVEVRMNDWMDIFCPRIIGSRSNTATSEMMFDLYNVSSKHYQNCNVTGDKH